MDYFNAPTLHGDGRLHGSPYGFLYGAIFIFYWFYNCYSRVSGQVENQRKSSGWFLFAGLVTLGNVQQWWLQEVLTKMNALVLFYGAAALTAITDNAALTYLGSLVELSESSKYYLVAGAVAGGGSFTVIANAPNPAGFGILKSSFGEEGISPLKLLLGALGPTIVVLLCLQFLPSL